MKYIALALAVGLLAYHSVYFKSLSQLKAVEKAKMFDATAYAKDYVENKLRSVTDSTIKISELVEKLKNDPKSAFKQYSHALSIGNVRFFLVKGSGIVGRLSDNQITLNLANGQKVNIATEFIFGNALRDAAGIIKVQDFENSADLNNVSAEINKIVRQEVLPAFKSKVKVGDSVSFLGAFELNQEHYSLENIEIVPVKLTIE
ncbi:DUF2291 domain-containing protein [Pelobium manganitolerans]|uniref:DUF2291 domain-containing protein n=1 Tax=Pelobium manganitolerans TaxID=1842495 RepID=UPI003FA36BA1